MHLIGQKFSRKKNVVDQTYRLQFKINSRYTWALGKSHTFIHISSFIFLTHLKRICKFPIELFLLLEDFGKQKNYSVVAL
jgi:hypothetical protein